MDSVLLPEHDCIANPTEDILLVLEGAPANLDPERVRAAIARELGVRITLAAQPASGASTLTLHGDVRSHIRLSYRSGDGRVTEREIDLRSEPDRAEEVVALLAGNLVRDEAAELGVALKKKAEKPPAPAPITTPPLARQRHRPPARRAPPRGRGAPVKAHRPTSSASISSRTLARQPSAESAPRDVSRSTSSAATPLE